jgi:cytochrome d ubiquinol oxidase subunit I
MKLATIEGMWKTEPAPASLTIFGLPDSEKKEMRYEVKVPWVLGLIATRSFSEKMPGIDELVARAEARIKNGLTAYDALERLKTNRNDRTAREQLSAAGGDLGYALLLKRYVGDPRKADAATIAKAAGDTAPSVAPLFWAFRIMVALGFYFVFLTGAAFWFASHRDFSRGWLLRLMMVSLPLPWVAAELGWVVAEYGRQPWAIDGILPTFLGVSSTSAAQVIFSFAGFVLFYSALLMVDVMLMRKYLVMGPVAALGLAPAPTEPATIGAG